MGVQWVVWAFLYLLGHHVHVLVSIEGLWNIEPALDVELLCDEHGFHYTVSTKILKLYSVQFRAFDKEGISSVIANSSVCGTSVVFQPCGFVLLQAAYNSCYALDQDDHYSMSVWVEREYEEGKFLSPKMKELKCPKHPVTVRCMHNGQMSVAISTDLTAPPLRLDSIHLKKGKSAVCGPILRSGELVLLQFSVSTCGTIFKAKDGTSMIYENVVVADINVKKKAAKAKTHKPQLRVNIQCTWDPLDLPTQNNDNPMQPLSKPDDGLDLPELQMRFAKDNLYQEFYTDGNHSALNLHYNTTIPIEVRILQNEDSNMTLVLNECWATPSRDPNHPCQLPILTNGCPYTGENSKSWYVSPVNSYDLSTETDYRRFIIHANSSGSPPSQMSLHGLVYFHCYVYVFSPSMLERYIPPCTKKIGRSTKTAEENFSGSGLNHGGATNMSVLVSSHVPVYFPATSESKQKGSAGALDHEWVRITIVASVFVGILMMVMAKRKCKTQK